jgi:ABC-type Fe3+-siderophore transport system permease subunit
MVSALVAWLGVAIRVVLDIGNISPGPVPDRGLFGPYHSGVLGILQRLVDSASYFTYWSNVAIAIVVTYLWRHSPSESTRWRRRHATALIMITLTGILYATLIAPSDVVTGWNIPDNILIHYVTPVLSVVTWLVVGPRGSFSWRESRYIYPVPIAYLIYTLIRGALTHRYPYGFFNVVSLGYPTILITMVVILVASYLVVALFVVLDQRLARRHRS